MEPWYPLVALVLMGLLLWWVLRNAEIPRQQIMEFSSRKLWKAEEEGERVFVRGDGWWIEVGRNYTAWIVEEPALEKGILSVRAGPPPPAAVTALGASFLQSLLQRAIVEMCGMDPGSLGELHMQSVGARVFDATHTLIATDPALIRRFVTEEVQKTLQEWPTGLDVPDLVLWEKGLRLVIVGPLRKVPETLEAMVEMGLRLRPLLRR